MKFIWDASVDNTGILDGVERSKKKKNVFVGNNEKLNK